MEKRQIYLELIGVIRHVLSGEPLPHPLHWDPVIRLATEHRLLGFAYRAAVGNDEVPAAVLEQVESAYFAAVGAQVRRDHYTAELFAALKEREIPYMPVKGYCLRELYPQRNWRMAQDIDILVAGEARDAIAEILTPLGFERRQEDTGDLYTLDRVEIRIHTEIPSEDVMKADGETPRLVAEKPSFRAADGRYTIARFQGDEGRYTLFCGAFDTTDGPKTNGTYLFAKFKDLPKLERKLVEGPYIHHMSEVRGDYTAHLRDLCRFIPGLVLDEAE